jgi:hypothetical protein
MEKMEQQQQYLAQDYPIVMETSWNSSHDRHWQSESRSLEVRPISNKISDQV